MRISYERTAFFDREDPNFRLTFDQDMRYVRGSVGLYDQVEGKLLLPEDARLMEVKVSNAYPMWFASLLSEENIHIHSFSKYGVAYKSYLKEDVFEDGEEINILARL
jgi:SPX domain protein involved in polyphosphate accumulation